MNEPNLNRDTVLEEVQSQDTLNELRVRINDIMAVENAQVDPVGRAIAFSGQLRVEAEDAFNKLKTRFQELGYIPLLRENESGERQMIVAIKGKLQAVLAQRPWLNLVLFLATGVTTTLFGGMYASAQLGQRIPPFETILSYGVPFSLTLLSILGVHELGHYVQARRHNLPVTLPYFIPAPFGLGTFGAFIQMRGAVENKRALFDVGIGGPIAGLLVAVPLYVVGLLISTISNEPAPMGRSLMVEGLIALFRPEAAANGILLNPVLLAARFGLIVTAINLLPVGQLDGGHIAYAALGRKWANGIGYATIAVMAILGVTSSSSWFIWLIFAMLSGVQHAAPLNDITPLDTRRNFVFLATAALFLSLFSAQPY
ncbi:MAG: site-2 protease family protein [Chloroflexi bacterium]|nr:site-2 protease family protein [Chloroflexota bacterium]